LRPGGVDARSARGRARRVRCRFPLAALDAPPHVSPTSARASFLIEVPGVVVAVRTNRPPRATGDLEDYRRDEQADDRVGDGNAESHHHRASDDADADEAVNTRVVPVGHESGAMEFAPGP